MLQGFKEFIMKGNVVDLAVGVVIGVSFGAVVNTLVKGFVMPLIGVFGGTPDFSDVAFTINGSLFPIGEFINALLSFLIISAVIYFFVITPMSKLMSKVKRAKNVDPIEKICPECLSAISIKARRCKACTSVVA